MAGSTPVGPYHLDLVPNASLEIMHVRPAGVPNTAPPLYSISYEAAKKSPITLYQGDITTRQVLGEARFHTLSSTVDIISRSRTGTMKLDTDSGINAFMCENLGSFGWHMDQMAMQSMELRDERGTRLATMRLGNMGDGLMDATATVKKDTLDILVPCEDYFMDLVLLSGMVAKTLGEKQVVEAASNFGEVL